jgi:uncharacterized membrane protein
VAHDTRGQVLAKGLGLLSLGLGAWQLLAPDDLADRTGLDDDPQVLATLRAVGVRELAVVPGLLGSRPTGWLWARVLGDAMDLALLRRAVDDAPGRRREQLVGTAGLVAGVAVLDLLAVRRARRRTRPLHLTAGITLRCTPQEAYAYWRDLANLPRFMAHLQEVRPGPDGRSRWTAKAPVGRLSWDAQTTEDVPGERLAWRSVGRTAVPNRGDVVFSPAPGDRGTEVRVHLDYDLPGGRLGAKVARLLGEDPHQQVEDDLRRFKQVLETGTVVVSDGSPGGTRARRHLFQRPAAPARSEK